LTPQELDILKKKISAVFLTGIVHGHDSIILTAVGCGFAKNRPKQVADVFVEVIKEFNGYFNHIVFAITDNPESMKRNPEGNVASFDAAIKSLKLEKKQETTKN